MKTFKKITVSTVLALLLILPSLSFAAGDSGAQTIKQIKVFKGGKVLIWGNTGDWENPDNCSSSSSPAETIVLVPENGAVIYERYEEMYALIVASYLQGKQISANLVGCSGVAGTRHPVVDNVTSF